MSLNTVKAVLILNAKMSKCKECGGKMKNGKCSECDITENGGRGSGPRKGQKRKFSVKIRDPHENIGLAKQRGVKSIGEGRVAKTWLKTSVIGPKVGTLSKKSSKGKKNRKFLAAWLKDLRGGKLG
jgi:hypothetical protein